MMSAFAELNLLQPFHGAVLGLFPGLPAEKKRHCHVLQRGKLRQQIVELPDEADFAVAEVGSAFLRQRLYLKVGAVYVTCRSPIKSAEDVQQGTLSSAG